jgi:putative nucleotidyltransferase with HDIG domain
MNKMLFDDEIEENLTELVSKVNASDISTIRNVVTAVIRIINDPDATAADLVDIIRIDPPLTGKILRIANSAFYSPRVRISDIRQAAIYIGFNTLKEIAFSQKVCEIFHKHGEIEGYSRTALWKHSVAVALLGKLIYRREFGETGENIYAAGILHDIGIIAEDQFVQEGFMQVLKKAETEGVDLIDAEEMVFGFNHTEVGMKIAIDWKLPQELIYAIGYHQGPIDSAVHFKRMVSTIYVADVVARKIGFDYWGHGVDDTSVYEQCLQNMDVDAKAVDILAEEVRESIIQMEDQGILFG